MLKTNKNETTLQLEKAIRMATSKVGIFGCYEVTVGFNGKDYGRVDYLTIDTKGIVRCYEVKSSVSDFRSKAKWTFVGHYNYFTMPQEVFDKVKDEIPPHVGVYVYGTCVKKPKKQIVTNNTLDIIRMSMIRSLSRDAEKYHSEDNPRTVENLKRRVASLEREKDKWYWKYRDEMMKNTDR